MVCARPAHRVAELPDPSIVIEPADALDPHDLHRIDEAATRDMPTSEPVQAIPYEEWLSSVWRHPFFTKEGSFGALVDGELALRRAASRRARLRSAMVMFTGTLREYRGRGLARAAKLASAHWAAANGITQIATGERRDERGDARGQRASWVPRRRPPGRVLRGAKTPHRGSGQESVIARAEPKPGSDPSMSRSDMSVGMVEPRRSDSVEKRQVRMLVFMRTPGSDPGCSVETCSRPDEENAMLGGRRDPSGNGFFASAARTCEVTQTGVARTAPSSGSLPSGRFSFAR